MMGMKPMGEQKEKVVIPNKSNQPKINKKKIKGLKPTDTRK